MAVLGCVALLVLCGLGVLVTVMAVVGFKP